MGNHAGKDGSGSTGSPLDFFHTPPTTPSEAELTAMALPSSASTNEAQQKDTPSPETASTAPQATSGAQKPSVPSEWAVISIDGVTSPGRNASDAAARHGKAAVSLGSSVSLPPSRGSPSEQSWQERDSGLEPQAAVERAGQEMTLVLFSLIEHYRASLGLSSGQDVTTGAVELLRRLVTERDELVEEVRSLKETLRMERAEWQQFQCDLQVAVSVADRLRVEAEQTVCSLQENYREVEDQLAQAISSHQEKDRELESLRAEHRDTCCKLSELTLQVQQERAELEALKNSCRATDSGTEMERKDSEDDQTQEKGKQEEETQEDVEEKPRETREEAEAKSVVKQKENEANEGVDVKAVRNEEANGTEKMNLTGKGVAEAYLRSLAALEKKKDEGCRQKDPRKIVMLSERSWSLSRLPIPSDPATQNETPKNTSTTLPLCKKEEPARGRRMDRILQRQDSWSSFYTKKQDEDQKSDSIRPQDGFSALLRRHGGSRRNSLLRWCQTRTQGYEKIEITNFSSSWEDGLAFCAVYHTYLPNSIPYSSLNPTDKKENLDLAFQTGESVGITATLTVEEMLKAGGPDWQRVLGYVESMFRHFEM
ncbi:cytospin-A-like [Myripristis murdjan]|uniref:Cytospin-A n=1 Tax=Myripristis murdjan TaxID=586833 RepID=A0A667YYJ0_9TELE|nr:cytospin-A-like [Myripristis murdjan]XP_029902772.1 cytospin-A-like [Myripristis murdjan]XP_029902773.1 cytospin-A-like [Myripristis murdjan]XP_029902774.1 cytospin-A-like [Myripristis murdjan]